MAIVQETIEIKSATNQTLLVPYGNNTVQFDIFWNEKYNCWYMNISKNNVILAYSVPLVLFSNLFNSTFYLGALYIVDTQYNNTKIKPIKSDLGSRLKMVRIYDPETI